ncbi:MAG: hypothetical protein ACLVCA_02720 [Peptoniphilus sp.]|uniref:hypothetical protein n=1 Tax=Peptoniphilus sp. TaxID=1971214 RepID=UPI003999C4E1
MYIYIFSGRIRAEGVDVKMRENFLKLDGFCILIIVLLIFVIICKKRKKDSEEKCKCKPICDFIKAYFIYIITLIISFFILSRILSANSNILQLIPDKEMGEALGLIISAVITVTGVFVGFYFNKRQTYKEIVTRERIEWLHKMQEALAEFLALTSKNDLLNGDKDKLDKARELYYLIISNLNVKEDKEKKNKNERDAVELLYKYANSKGLDVELNFVRNLDSEDNKDSKDTKSRDDLEKENEDLKDYIRSLEDTITFLQKNDEADSLAGLKRKEIISKYTEIFNETWNRIKDEAD